MASIENNPFKQKIFILLAPLLAIELTLVTCFLFFGIDSMSIYAFIFMLIDFCLCCSMAIYLFSNNTSSTDAWMNVSNYSNLNSIAKNLNDLNKKI